MSANTGPVVLLMQDAQGSMIAVGPFGSQSLAQAWEDRNPQRSEDFLGMARLVKQSGDLDSELAR